MIPFARVLKYGNELPKSQRIVDFYVDPSNAKPTTLMMMENGEVWGNTAFGQYLGFASNVASWGHPYFVMSNVKAMYPCTWGTLLITLDNKVMYTGRQQPFNGNTTEYWKTFQDMTSFYTDQGIDVNSIKKVCTSTNTTMLLLNNGDIYAHGTNTSGVMGLGHTNPNYVPTKIWTGAVDLWLSNSNAVIRIGAKTFYGTGTNSYYQMGTNATATVYSTWTQILKAATDDSAFELNAFRMSDTHFMVYGTSTTFYACGRNYTGAWGVSTASVDGNYASFKGTLPFTPGNLNFFFGGKNQVYWTNLVIDNTGKLYIAGTANGGGGINYSVFQNLPIGTNISAAGYKCGTSTRMYAIMDCTANNFMWARGTSSTAEMGYTPLSTPLKTAWTHITDFVFNK